jgi:hypothetical protein
MLRNELELSLKNSWDEAYEAALGSALTVKRAESDSSLYPPRNLPLLYLDGHPKTDAAIERYLSAWQAGKLTPAIYAQLREAPYSDPPHKTYLGFVAQAYVLGVTNRWQLSAVTAALAISVARDYRDRDSDLAKKYRVSGREAAFWRAYSLRSSAREVHDLDRAWTALKLARDYSAEDLKDAEGSGLDTKEIRFDAEALAIDVTAICFEMFSSAGKPQLTPLLLDKAALMLSYSSERLEFITEKTSLPELLTKNVDRFSAFCFQRIITNFFTLALCIDGRRKLDNSEIEKRLAQFQFLVGHLRTAPTNKLSFLVLVIYNVATIVFSKDQQLRRQARIEFRSLYKDMAQNCTMPYDTARFSFLSDKVAATNS